MNSRLIESGEGYERNYNFIAFICIFISRYLRCIVELILLGMVSSSILQNASSMARILRHLTVARSDLDRHNITAIVSSLGSQSLRDGSDQLSISRSALKQLLARLQLRAHHVSQRLEIAEKNSLNNKLTIEHLHVFGLHITPGVNLLHVVRNSVILGNRALLLGIHNRSSLLYD